MDRTIKLAVIGAHGAGKTTLMAGYAAVRPSIGGTDDTSRKFLEDQLRAWDNGKWPDPTNEEKTINFRIGQNGRDDVTVSFAEYKGENFSGNKDSQYLERIVGKPDAAMLLANPQMPDFKDPQKRAGLEIDTKKVIDHLARKTGERTVLALVWTASDTDSAKSDEFGSFTKRIRSYVGDRLPCQEFSVSLFGPMADELVPPGRPTDPVKNTSPKPFDWTLGTVESLRSKANRKKLLSKAAKAVGAVLLAAILGIGLRSCYNQHVEGFRYRLLKNQLLSFDKAPETNAKPQSLHNWIMSWTEAKNNATDRTRAQLEELKGTFEKQRPIWQRKQLEKEVKDLYAKLYSVQFPLPGGQNVANLRQWYMNASSLAEASSEYSMIPESEFGIFRDQLKEAQSACKQRFLSDAVKQKTLSEEKIAEVWKNLLSDDEFKTFVEQIKNPVIRDMRTAADKAIESLDSHENDPVEVAHDCKDWCDKNRDNLFREEVVDHAISLIGRWLENFAEQCLNKSFDSATSRKEQDSVLSESFDMFKNLCCYSLKGDFWNDYATQWPVALARECASESWCHTAAKHLDAFPQTFTLSKVDVVWENKDHKWSNAFEGWTISFKLVFRERDGKETVLYEGLKDDKHVDKVTLSRRKAEKEKGSYLGQPLQVWPQDAKTKPRSETVHLGQRLILKVHIRECMSSNYRPVTDGKKDFEVELATDRAGKVRESTEAGFLEKTVQLSFNHTKGTADTKSTLIFRFHVICDGRTLVTRITDAKAKAQGGRK